MYKVCTVSNAIHHRIVGYQILQRIFWKTKKLFPSLNFHTRFLHTLIDARVMYGRIIKKILNLPADLWKIHFFFPELNFHTLFTKKRSVTFSQTTHETTFLLQPTKNNQNQPNNIQHNTTQHTPIQWQTRLLLQEVLIRLGAQLRTMIKNTRRQRSSPNNRSAKQMPTMKTSKCYIKKAQASTTTKTPKALLTAQNARNLMTMPKRQTTPKRYTLLAKTKVRINSPPKAKEKITLDRHQKVMRAALWNHLRIIINQAHKD